MKGVLEIDFYPDHSRARYDLSPLNSRLASTTYGTEAHIHHKLTIYIIGS